MPTITSEIEVNMISVYFEVFFYYRTTNPVILIILYNPIQSCYAIYIYYNLERLFSSSQIYLLYNQYMHTVIRGNHQIFDYSSASSFIVVT